MQATFESAAGLSTDPPLTKAVEEIRVLQERFATAGIDDHSRTFNTERLRCSSCRGCSTLHWRSSNPVCAEKNPSWRTPEPTLPNRDDEHFLAHTWFIEKATERCGSATFRSLSLAGHRANACMGGK